VIAIGAGVFAFLQSQAAERAATVADGQRLGAQGITESNLDLALLLGRQGLALDVDNVTRANMLSAIVRSPAAIGAWRPIPGRPLGIAVSPDAQTLLVWNNQGKGYFVNANSGTLIGDPVDADFGAFTPDGSVWTASRDANGNLVISSRDPDHQFDVKTFTIPQGAAAWAVAADLSTYMTVAPDLQSIDISDAQTGALVQHIAAQPDTMILDVWPAGPQGVIAIRHDGTFDLNDQQAANDAYTGPIKIDYYPHGATQPATSIPAVDELFGFDAQNNAIAVHEGSDSVGIYDLPSGTRRDFTVRHESLGGITFSPDGSFLMTSGDDKMLRVWDANTGQLRQTLAGHNGRVFSPAISQTDAHTTAWSVSLDGQLIEWDLSGDRSIDRPFNVGPGDELNDGSISLGMAVSPDGKLLATTGTNGTVDIVDAHSLAVVEQLQLDAGSKPFSVAFAPDSKTLVEAGEGPNPVQRFDVSTWQTIGDPLTGFADTVTPPGGDASSQSPNIVRSVVYSPDGTTIAAGSEDGTIRFWDAQTGAPIGQPINVGAPVWDIAYSPDGKKLAATYRPDAPVAGKAGVWDLAYGQQLYSVSVDDDYGAPWVVTFSHDGTMLATGGGIGYVRFWDAATGAQVGAPILADAGWVASLEYTADDSLLLASGTDGTVRLLDPIGRGQLGSALPGGDADSVATIGPDGRVFVVYEDDGHGYVWDVSLNSMENFACSVPGRTLTQDEWQRYLPDRPYNPACVQSPLPSAGSAASP